MIQDCKLAITSMSLGYADDGHDIFGRLEQAALYGYKGIEMFFGDIQYLAESLTPRSTKPERQLEDAAYMIGQACRRLGLEVVSLQPFAQYEGLIDRHAHSKRITELLHWFKLAKLLGTNLILIPANFLPAEQLEVSTKVAIADLQEAADLGARQRPPIKFCYEALSWSTRCDTWEASWQIVQAVDRPNFGICLDTFNIAGRIFADPTQPSGCNRDARGKVLQSLRRMLRQIQVEKIFLLQVVDAEKLAEPLTPSHPFSDPALPPRMAWSRNCRLFYGEHDRGAYLPIFEICEVVLVELGFTGWVSAELFNRRMHDSDTLVPRELAQRGAIAWQKLLIDITAVQQEA